MTSGGYNFNDFPENQLTKFRVQFNQYLDKILSIIKGVGGLSPPPKSPETSPMDDGPVYHVLSVHLSRAKLITCSDNRYAVAKFSKSRVWSKVP